MDKAAALIMGGHPSMVQTPHNPSTPRSEGCGGRTSVIDLRGRRNHPAYDPDLNPNVIYIGLRQWWGAGRLLDAHPLGNPYRAKRYGLHESLVKYADWILGNDERVAIAKELRGKTLACWCLNTRLACHGLIVAAVADGRLDDIDDVLELARGGAVA